MNFCPSCGKPFEEESDDGRRERSGLWYILPFFFGIIGALIMYFSVKEDDPRMANYGMVFGLIMMVIGGIIMYAIFVSSLSSLYRGL